MILLDARNKRDIDDATSGNRQAQHDRNKNFFHLVVSPESSSGHPLALAVLYP